MTSCRRQKKRRFFFPQLPHTFGSEILAHKVYFNVRYNFPEEVFCFQIVDMLYVSEQTMFKTQSSVNKCGFETVSDAKGETFRDTPL